MERVLAGKVNYLVNHGHDVTIITTDQNNRSNGFHFDSRVKQIDLGVNYESTNGKNILTKTFCYFTKHINHRKRLTAILIKEQFDVVISMYGHEMNFLCKIKDGSKKIAEIHFTKIFRQLLKRKGLWMLADKVINARDAKHSKYYDKMVVLTNLDKKAWNNQQNVIVIHNPSSFSTLETPRDLSAKQVIAVGRLSYEKGFDMLLETWRYVEVEHPDWTLAIYGDGENKPALEEYVEQNNIQNVSINSHTTNIREKYLESSIFVLSSRTEGMPMVMLEIMAHGVPVVSFDCPCGPSDIIDNGKDGILVPLNDTKKLAEGICQLIENKTEREAMGAAAIEKIESKFTQDIIMPQWIELFESLIKKKQ